MAQIKARALADATTELAPAERIRAIAAKVRCPQAFAAAQAAYADLQKRHAGL
jgi:hypothetical protein